MERWLAAWNSHQPERLLELMTDDIVYGDAAASSQTMRGHAQQAAPASLSDAMEVPSELAWRSLLRCVMPPPGVRPTLPPTTRLVDYLGVIDGPGAGPLVSPSSGDGDVTGDRGLCCVSGASDGGLPSSSWLSTLGSRPAT